MGVLRRIWSGLSDMQRYAGVAAMLVLGVSFVIKVLSDGMDLADWLIATGVGFLTILVLGLLFFLAAKRSRRVSLFMARAIGPIGGIGIGLGLMVNRLSDFAAALVLAGLSGTLLAVTLSFSTKDEVPRADMSDDP